MMSVPERKLLIAMDDIAGIVDIQRHRHRRGGIAGAVDVDHCDHHAGQFARGRRILPPAHRWLAGKSRARSRQLAQRQTETRIVAQGVEIIGILIAASNREHAGTQDVIEAMDHPRRVTRIGNASCKPLADPHCTFSLRQQQHATIRGEPATIKRGGHFLAPLLGIGMGLRYRRSWRVWPVAFSALRQVRTRHPDPNSDQRLTPLPPTLCPTLMNKTG
ncbi:UNVERIFIED_ORG: hypothetical protein M2348_002903 [Sphingomonas sp. R1F5B]